MKAVSRYATSWRRMNDMYGLICIHKKKKRSLEILNALSKLDRLTYRDDVKEFCAVGGGCGNTWRFTMDNGDVIYVTADIFKIEE